MKVQLYRDDAGIFWRWRVVTENGRIVADGTELYDAPVNAERAVSHLAELFQGAYKVERLEPTSAPDVS